MSFVEDLSELVAANAAGVLSVAPHWQRAALGSVASVINGFAFPSKHFKASKGFPLVRIRDVVDGRSDTLYDGPIPDGYWVNDGDLLVGMDGDFNCALWRGGKALLNQRVCKIVPDETRLRKQFLLYVLPGYLKLINDYTSSVTVKHLSSRTLQQLPLPLPELAEQDRLIARIDALFAEIDEGEAALAEALAGVETYRKALLKAAVTGELTADWRAANPPQENGEQLLARILANRRARWHADPKNARKTYAEPAGLDMDGLPELPEGWAWASVQQLSTLVTSGSRGWSEFYADSGSLFIRAANLNQDRLDLSEVAFVQVPNNSEGARTKVVQGDFLITITGANVTKCGVVTEPLDDAYVSQHVGLVRPVTPEIGRYLYLWSRAYGGGKQYLEDAAYGAGKPGLNLPNIYEMAVALPSPAEMVEIEQRVQLALDRVPEADFVGPLGGQLRQSILAAAFRGELAA